MSQERMTEEKSRIKHPQPEGRGPAKQPPVDSAPAVSGMIGLQQQVGNRAVQRLLAQRSGGGAFDLDDDTADRINQARGDGHPLDGAVQANMGQALGHDFSGVRVHTSTESDGLNRQLGAKAFTTGQDVFFRNGAYNPNSSGGQELIAHELTHVVQQGAGVGGTRGKMAVNPPGDVYEQEADAVVKSVTSTPVQRQAEEEEVQMQEDEKEVQMQTEEEEMLQT